MALTEADKVNVRRLLGYETLNANTIAIVRTNYAKLEFKMSHLSADEEAFLTERLSLILDMEAEIYDARANLGIKAAGEFIQNPNEIGQRRSLMNAAISEMGKFLGVPVNNQGGGNIIV